MRAKRDSPERSGFDLIVVNEVERYGSFEELRGSFMAEGTREPPAAG